MTVRRVYHPTLNSWADIDSAQSDAYKAQGWRLTKPDHVDDSGALPVKAVQEAAAPAEKPAKS